jgi:type II secretory ATPase GspE/PulE/Tfp pilus assembly ATPase PilB-like protein
VDLREGLHRSRPVPVHPRGPDVPLQLRAHAGAQTERSKSPGRSAQPEPDRRADAAAQQEAARQGRHALADFADLLKKTEQSQRVLEEVTEGFALDVVVEEGDSTKRSPSTSSPPVDSDIAPVIKLVDTTIFNALERRASDIHIESRDQEVAIKYRIDGVLHYAMPPIAKDWHSTIISRIKVMSELDIAERASRRTAVSACATRTA